MGGWRDGLEDVGESGDEGGAVGLMDLVAHGGVDERGVRWRVGQGGGEEGEALQVEDLDVSSSALELGGSKESD